METKKSTDLFLRLRPHMEKPSKDWYVLFLTCALLLSWGFYAFYRQFTDGHGITGMRDNVVWGVYIVNFIYLLGLSYAGALISAIFHLARIEWGKPFIRILELFSFICLIIGPIYILLCIGKLDRLLYLFMYPRLQSPITWDIIAIMTDLVFCTVYLYMTFIKDIAKMSIASETMNMSNWRKKLYKIMAFGFTGTKQQISYLDKAMDIMASIIIPTVIVAYSLLAWLFGMNLRPGWNSTIFAPYFVLTAAFSGVALLIILLWISRNLFKIKDIFTDKYFYILGYGLLLLSFIFGYFTFSEYITTWYNTQHATSTLLDKVQDFDQYGYMYLATWIFATALPIIFIGFPWFRKPKTIVFTAVFVLLALYMNRYLIMVPVLETPYLTIVNPDPAYYNYIPTWVEYALSAAGIAAAVMLFMLLTKFVPILPLEEMKEGKRKIKIFGITLETHEK